MLLEAIYIAAERHLTVLLLICTLVMGLLRCR